MSVPGHQTFMRPFLEILNDGREHVVRDSYSQLADRFALTDEDRNEQIPSGTQRLLHNRVGWARTYLLKAGLLESPRRGVIRITQRGKDALASSQQLDNQYLRQFPEFIDFVKGIGEEPSPVPAEGGAIAQREAVGGAERTPDELITAGFQQLQKALASDILERVRGCSPEFFERLVVELLVKMGYGGSLC